MERKNEGFVDVILSLSKEGNFMKPSTLLLFDFACRVYPERSEWATFRIRYFL